MDFTPETHNVLWRLRNDAQAALEWSTKKLWLHILHHHIFMHENFVLGTEQPPVKYDSLKRIDVFVEWYNEETMQLDGFMIIEKKKGKASPDDIAKVEKQLFERAREHLNDNPSRTGIWGMTNWGPNARLWYCSKKGLTPVFPRVQATSDRDFYEDVAWTSDVIRDYIHYMIDYKTPKAADVEEIYSRYDEDHPNAEMADTSVNLVVTATMVEVIVEEEKTHKEKKHKDYATCRLHNGAQIKLGIEWDGPMWDTNLKAWVFVNKQHSQYWTASAGPQGIGQGAFITEGTGPEPGPAPRSERR